MKISLQANRDPLTAMMVIGCILVAMSCKGKEGGAMTPDVKTPEKKVLDSPIAGSWYQANADVLNMEIKGLYEAAEKNQLPEPSGRLLGLISPHAGYRYSGVTAASGYRLLKGLDIERIIVLGPSHRFAFRGIALTDATHWRTPLGELEIDVEAVKSLSMVPGFDYRALAFASEHSVDIQLPLIQKVAPKVKIVPLVVGEIDSAIVSEAGRALRKLLNGKTIVVASSDFTHYGPNYGYIPFRDDVEKKLEELADSAFKAISTLDPEKVADHVRNTGDTICGYRPIQILLATIPRRAEATLIARDTSGRLTGDFTNSVSYLSIAFSTIPSKGPFINLDFVPVDEQIRLLRIARETLAYETRGEPIPDFSDTVKKGVMTDNYGVFVTLKKRGELRGCIGSIIGTEPLWRGVIRNTINAASHDPRFPRVTTEEEPDIRIEISVLTPPRDVLGPEDIVAGRDGVILSQGASRAVFLPQVAPEQGWDVDEMLDHLAMKAGLRPGAWRSGTTFQTFQAHVFAEREDVPVR